MPFKHIMFSDEVAGRRVDATRRRTSTATSRATLLPKHVNIKASKPNTTTQFSRIHRSKGIRQAFTIMGRNGITKNLAEHENKFS